MHAKLFVFSTLLLAGCAGAPPADAQAREFLAFYTAAYQPMSRAAAEAQWVAQTDVTDAHTAEAVGTGKVAAAFSGSTYVIAKVKELLARAAELSPIVVAQLHRVLLRAAESPGTLPDVVAARIEAEGRQSKTQDSFEFELDGKRASANDLDKVLRESRDLDMRLRAWRAAKAIGVPLRPGLVELRQLRNRVAREMDHASFFALQVADYGMTEAEMMALLERILGELRPLYEQLHCWVRHELARRYAVPVPELIPAHWLSNRWGQEWPGLVEGIELDSLFRGRTAESVVQQAEAFYVSMGFPRLPPSFWEKSSLYPLPPDSKQHKNSHASAWHIDLDQDVRSLMSVEPDFQWFETTHHELGHIHYYLAYSRPEVPPLLREGANRAFHEGIGELIALAAGQQPYLREIGVLPEERQVDQVQWMLNAAMQTIVFMPWSVGTMSHWERDLYAGLPPEQWNQRWWEYVARYQGIAPPEPRGEEWCDPATKTHVNDDPAQYYDYALATVLKHQLHEHIATRILGQDPRSCSYYGSKAAGDYLRGILSLGATRDWRQVLREATGEDLSARAMLDYYAPLRAWLERENAGRKVGF